jgi:hypothetical protein
MGRHSPAYLAQQRCHAGRHAVEMVDARTGTAHFLTIDAAADGLPRGQYVAICGEEVLPAALVAREARYCRLCAPLPVQRSRARR